MKITFPSNTPFFDDVKENEKLTLLIYPWQTSIPSSLAAPRAALGFPIDYVGGKLTAKVPADFKVPTTSAVFAVQYSYSVVNPGVPDVNFKTMVCRTGLVSVKDALPSELLVLQLPELPKFDLSVVADFIKSGGNNWVGMVPRMEPIEVENGLIVIHVCLTGIIGTMSGNIRVYTSLKPAQIPDLGRYLTLELEKTEGVGLDKGAVEKAIRNNILPGIQKMADGLVKDEINKNIAPLDAVAELYSDDKAITSSRGLLLNNWRLGMITTTSGYITYPIA